MASKPLLTVHDPLATYSDLQWLIVYVRCRDQAAQHCNVCCLVWTEGHADQNAGRTYVDISMHLIIVLGFSEKFRNNFTVYLQKSKNKVNRLLFRHFIFSSVCFTGCQLAQSQSATCKTGNYYTARFKLHAHCVMATTIKASNANHLYPLSVVLKPRT